MTPERARATTEHLLTAVVLVVALWDVVAYRFGGGKATVSTVVTEKARKNLIIAVAIGTAIGHWFW